LFRETRCELLFQRALSTDRTGGDGGDSAAVGRRGCRVSDRGRRCALMEGASTVYTHWETKKKKKKIPTHPNERRSRHKRREKVHTHRRLGIVQRRRVRSCRACSVFKVS